MKCRNKLNRVHPKGELKISPKVQENQVLDSYGGVVRVEWDPEAKVSPFGQMAYFVNFLKTAGLFEEWVKDCPLNYVSNNSSKPVDILGTLMLSILAGHRRYAHIMGIRSDRVTPELLGMKRVVSEDAVRRGLKALDAKVSDEWLRKHLQKSIDPLLLEPWILDVDTTVKPLYGKQESAVVGYNPHKPGRPSHAYHTYFIGNLRLILDVEVQAGNQTASSYAQPRLWEYLDNLPKEKLPAFVRGDIAWGCESAIKELESRKIKYLFKLKKSPNVNRLISEAFENGDWEYTDQGFEGLETTLQLTGWSKKRRVIILRRRLKEPLAVEGKGKKAKQLELFDLSDSAKMYEVAVLVTSLKNEILSIGQYYRDRADCENVFDELKNQWSWSGYNTQDVERCKIIARIGALIFNWWSLYAGLAFPNKHAEAITSRPLLLNAVARQTRHAGQKTISITSAHGRQDKVQQALTRLNDFLSKIKSYAEQLSSLERYQIILSRIFVRFLQGRIIGGTPPCIGIELNGIC